MDQYQGPTTTANSQSEGRMKVDAGKTCSHGKKKCLKCEMKKHMDGKGGPKLSFPIGSGGYGATKAQRTVNVQMPALPVKMKKNGIPKISSKTPKGMKYKSVSGSKLMKGLKLGKKVKSPKGMKIKSLKSILRGGR